MPIIHFKRTEEGLLDTHPNTLHGFDSVLSEALLENRLERIKRIFTGNDNARCYIVGMGGIPKRVYEQLSTEEGIEILFFHSNLPAYLKFLTPIVASYAGLVKINAPEKLEPTFKKLINLTMAGIFIFNKSFENKFIDFVNNHLHEGPFSYSVKEERGYFFYVVDADNFESETGMVEILSYGKEAKLASELF